MELGDRRHLTTHQQIDRRAPAIATTRDHNRTSLLAQHPCPRELDAEEQIQHHALRWSQRPRQIEVHPYSLTDTRASKPSSQSSRSQKARTLDETCFAALGGPLRSDRPFPLPCAPDCGDRFTRLCRYRYRMGHWFIVYCRRQVRLDAEAMRCELDVADLWTVAEALDLADAEMDTAIESISGCLRLESADDSGESVDVHWKPAGRPIQISSVTGKQALQDIAETLEEVLPSASDLALAQVRDHVSQCQQVVYFEMGIKDFENLGAAIAWVLAFLVAEAGDGLVLYHHKDWISPGDRAVTIWTSAGK